MVLTGSPSSGIEIRLRKIAGDVTAEPTYFDEYARSVKGGSESATEAEETAESRRYIITTKRYIVPDDVRYTVEITLKKGFNKKK